jgi:hypothetical protein
LFLVFMTFLVGVLAWGAPGNNQDPGPVFTAKDRTIIENYYKRIIGALAPGSIDRSGFSLAVEKSIAAGSHLPRSVEKELERLPQDLETQLSSVTGGYERFKIGRHVILLKRSDLAISDVLKNIALKNR